MYKMPYFTEPDNEVVLAFMQAHPFATLIGCDNSTPSATQVPLLVSERDGALQLQGHIMRGTDHHRAFEKNNEVLVLFTGPHCYVSSSWYKERNVGATWNYITVQVRGNMRFTDDAGVIDIITRLTAKYEAGQQHPELVEHMPQEYVQGLAKAIAGFSIEVKSIAPIFKLSQNRSDESYKSIVSHLEAKNDAGSEEVAAEMIKRRLQLFES